MQDIFGPLPRGQLLFRCQIPGRPYVKKNVAKFYKGRLVYSANYRAWAETALLYVRQAMIGSNLFPIRDPLILSAHFHFETRQSEPDLSALYEGIQDILQCAGVVVNDRQIVSHDGSTKLFGVLSKTDVALFSLGK